MVKLAAGLHDRLVPSHRRFQDAEEYRHLGSRLAVFHDLSPSQQSFGRLVGQARAGQDVLHQVAFALSERNFKVVALDDLDAKKTVFRQVEGMDSFVSSSWSSPAVRNFRFISLVARGGNFQHLTCMLDEATRSSSDKDPFSSGRAAPPNNSTSSNSLRRSFGSIQKPISENAQWDVETGRHAGKNTKIMA